MKLLNRFKKILVIEDDEGLRRAIEEKLSSDGFHVLTATDGAQGLKTAVDVQPNLILLDLMLPKEDGLSLLRELRQDAWGKQAAVIVITVLSETDTRRSEAEELGVLEYIDKSKYDLDEIRWKVKNALKHRTQK